MKNIITPLEYRNALKGKLRGGWLFFGEEAYLKRHSLEQTRKAILGDSGSDSFSHKKISCLDFDIEKMTDAVSTVSLFGMQEEGAVTLTEFHELRFSELKEEQWRQLENLLSTLDSTPDTVLIVVTTPEELDTGILPKQPSKAFSRLAEYLTPVQFAHEDDPRLLKWMAKHFAAAKLKIEIGVCEAILQRAGHDMYTLDNEMQKLCAYVKENNRDTVTAEDVRLVTCTTLETDAFAFTNALMNRDCDRAYAILTDMRLRKEKGVMILSSVARVASELYTVGQLTSSGMTYQEISKKLKMHEYKVKLCQRFAKDRSERKLRSLIEECYNTDIKMKSTGLDEYTLLSRLVVLFAAK